MAFGDAVWGEIVKDRMTNRLLLSAQRGAPLSVTAAYHTTSKEALPVLAGILPLDLAVRQLGRVSRSRRSGLGWKQELGIGRNRW